MKPAKDPQLERIEFLTKRGEKQGRALKDALDRLGILEGRVDRLTNALKCGLPHMNLNEMI